MNERTNIMEFVKEMPFGLAIHSIVNVSYKKPEDKSTPCVAFFIKEHSENIRELKKEPHMMIEVRSGVIPVKNVYPILVMFMINNNSYYLFSTWINYLDEYSGRETLMLLSTQPELYFFHVGNKGEIEKKTATKNNLTNYFKTILDFLDSKHVEWTDEEFNNAKIHIYNQFPQDTELWNTLGEGGKTKNV